MLHTNYKANYNVLAQRDDYYRLQKIQINTIKGKLGSNNKGLRKGQQQRLQSNKETKEKSNVKCYKYSKKGYYTYECNAQKQHYKL